MGAIFRHRHAGSTSYAVASHRCLIVLQWIAALGLLLFAALAASQVVLAATSHSRDQAHSSRGAQSDARAPSHAAPQLSPEQAADRAREEYGGRVLNVVLEHGSSGPYYRVKLLDGGRVRVAHVGAGQ